MSLGEKWLFVRYTSMSYRKNETIPPLQILPMAESFTAIGLLQRGGGADDFDRIWSTGGKPVLTYYVVCS